MTNDLVLVLRERADAVTDDLDAADVLRRGRRRLVRRRVRGGAIAVALTCGLVAGAATLAPRSEAPSPPIATQSMATPSFSMGSVIVRDGRVVDVGDPVRAYVRVPAGTVFVVWDGRVRLLPADSLEPVTIGRTSAERPHLVSDPEHDQVAWVAFPEESAPEYVVYDVATRSTRSGWPDTDTAWTFSPERAWIYALDGDDLYRLDSRGAVLVDLVTGRTEILAAAADRATIGAAAGGTVAWRSTDAAEGWVVGPRFGEGVPTGSRGTPLLSPDGTYLGTDGRGGGVQVHRTGDGVAVTPVLPRSADTVAYGWSDDDHLLVVTLGAPDADRVRDLEFRSCSVSTRRCEESQAGQWQAVLGTFNLPTGDPVESLRVRLTARPAPQGLGEPSAAVSVRAARDS